MNEITKALRIALNAHRGQVDKAGEDYILHSLYVALNMITEEEKIVAILHDVVEDTGITFEDLRLYKFDEKIIEAIKAITKKKGEKYSEYILRVSKNKLAKTVKVYDLIHNSDLTRLSNITELDLRRREKYASALHTLLSTADFID